MKNRILLSLMFLLTSFSMANAEVVLVGKTGYSTPELPANVGYCYSRSQQIYTAAEIGRDGSITSISFSNGSSHTFKRTMAIYLDHTNLSSFPGQNSFQTLNTAVKVYDGEVTFNSLNWCKIEFDTPFEYNGTSNLLVVVYDYTGAYLTYDVSFTADKATQRAIFARSDDNSNMDSGYYSGYRNTIKLEFDDTIGSGVNTSTCLPTNIFFRYSLTQQIYTKDELRAKAQDITSVSFYNTGSKATRNLDIYMVPTNNVRFVDGTSWLNYTENDKVFSGDVTFEKNEWTAIGFNIKAFPYNGTSNVVLIVDDNTGTYQAEMPFLAFVAAGQSICVYDDYTNHNAGGLGDYQGTVLNVKNQVRFNEVGLDATPHDLTVSDITYQSATINWNSAGTQWNLDYKTAEADTWYHAVDPSTYYQTLTTPTYTLTGLAQETTYDIRVRTVNDDGTYSDYISTQFTTPQRFPRPTDVKVLSVSPHSAILRWTENCGATQWQLSSYPLSYRTDKNPYIITGLTPGTTYTFGIRSVIVDDEGDEYYSNWSEGVTFTTPAVNPIPEISSVAPTPNSATITWEGESDSYIVRYRKTVYDFDDSTLQGWTTIDADGDGYTWVTSTSPFDYHKSSVDLTGKGYAGSQAFVLSGSYTNSGGRALTPDNYLVSPKVTLGGSISFYACTHDVNYPAEHFGVAVSTTGNTDAADFTTIEEWTMTSEGTPASSRRKIQGNWGYYTVDLSAYEGQEGYVAIRHFDCTDQFILNVDDIYISGTAKTAGNWVTIETSDKSVTLEGLEPNTEYEFEVIGIMNHQPDASSSFYTFTTLDRNPAPFDIVITPTMTSAHLSWTGYGENYTVEYREVHPGGIQRTFFEDFESGLDMQGWTVYTLSDKLPDQEQGWYITSSGSSMAACSNSYYYSNGDVALSADNWLITPLVDLGSTLKYREWVRGDYPDSYEVRLSTTGKATTDFTVVLRSLSPGEGAGSTNQGVWTNVELDMSAYAGQKGYIAIHHKCSDKFWMFIDNFSIYQDMSETGELHSVTVNETECTLEGLTPNTTYECRITSWDYNYDGIYTTTFFTTLNEPYDIVLDDNGDNTSILKAKEGAYVNATINNRTFKKDGTWQGICLPFDVDVENSILVGADVRTLESCPQVYNEVYMNCLTPVTEMKAGTPYIIKWDSGEDIVNPVFEGVVIDLADRDVLPEGYGLGAFNRNGGRTTSLVYSPFECNNDEKYIFLMNGTSMLTPVTANAGLTIHAFDIMFSVQSIYTDGTIVLLNTGEYNDVITGVSPLKETEEEAAIYNVAGQRLAKRQRGINIVNGKKVLVK